MDLGVRMGMRRRFWLERRVRMDSRCRRRDLGTFRVSRVNRSFLVIFVADCSPRSLSLAPVNPPPPPPEVTVAAPNGKSIPIVVTDGPGSSGSSSDQMSVAQSEQLHHHRKQRFLPKHLLSPSSGRHHGLGRSASLSRLQIARQSASSLGTFFSSLLPSLLPRVLVVLNLFFRLFFLFPRFLSQHSTPSASTALLVAPSPTPPPSTLDLVINLPLNPSTEVHHPSILPSFLPLLLPQIRNPQEGHRGKRDCSVSFG